MRHCKNLLRRTASSSAFRSLFATSARYLPLAQPLQMATAATNTAFCHELWRSMPKRWHQTTTTPPKIHHGSPCGRLQTFPAPCKAWSPQLHPQNLRHYPPLHQAMFRLPRRAIEAISTELVTRSVHSHASPGGLLEDDREVGERNDSSHGSRGARKPRKAICKEDEDGSGSDVDMADCPLRHFVLGALGEEEEGAGKANSTAARLKGANKWWRNREHYKPRSAALVGEEGEKYQALGGWRAGQKPAFPYEDRFQMGNGKELSSLEVAALLRPLMIDPRQAAIERAVAGRTYAVVPVIEGLVDLGNIAAVSRTAEAMGCQQMHIICNSSFSKYKKHRQVAKGADKWLDIEVWEDSRECLSALKAHGYRLAVTHLSADTVPIHEVDWTIPTAIILGNEKWGVSDVALEMSDVRCSIPIGGFVESFNISVAAGIILYQMVRDRVARQGFHGDLSEKERDILRAEFYLRHSRQTQDVIARHFESDGKTGSGSSGNDKGGFKSMLRGELSSGIDRPWYLQESSNSGT